MLLMLEVSDVKTVGIELALTKHASALHQLAELKGLMDLWEWNKYVFVSFISWVSTGWGDLKV